MKRKKILTILLITFCIRLAANLVRSFGEIVQPHVWRQMDTLGMSYRYWLRFTHEPISWKLLLPAVLQSGDGNGILPVEFPSLNLLFSPFWYFGPYWGKVLIYIFFTLTVFFLCFRLSKTKVWFAPSFLLLPYISYSADYIDKFMPDTVATLLVVLGAIQYLKQRFWGCTLILLGLLIKPTAIVALGILLLLSQFRKHFVKNAIPLLIPIIVALGYYTFGLKWIDQFREGNLLLFAVDARNPIHSLMEIISNPTFIFNQIQNRMFMAFGGTLLAVGIFLMKIPKKSKIVGLFLGILSLQFLTVAALDGAHSAQHDYYYMGLAPVVAVLVWLVCMKTPKLFSAFLLLAVFIHGIELSARYITPSKLTGFYRSRNECERLKKETPQLPWGQDFVFRSKDEPFPSLGLCFGERQGSKKSEYGIYYKTDAIPNECKQLRSESQYQVVSCGK